MILSSNYAPRYGLSFKIHTWLRPAHCVLCILKHDRNGRKVGLQSERCCSFPFSMRKFSLKWGYEIMCSQMAERTAEFFAVILNLIEFSHTFSIGLKVEILNLRIIQCQFTEIATNWSRRSLSFWIEMSFLSTTNCASWDRRLNVLGIWMSLMVKHRCLLWRNLAYTRMKRDDYLRYRCTVLEEDMIIPS